MPLEVDIMNKILCVEDEPEILRDIADELRDQGFLVHEAPNAQTALEMILSDRPDLVICDIQMPGMSGIELLQHLRARNDATGDIPFIFLTAFGDRDHVLAGRRAGADDYLVKPVDYDLLLAAINTRLENFARRTRHLDPIHSERLPGRAQLQQDIDALQAPAELAVFSIDNPNELIRRVGRRAEDYFSRISRRTAQDSRIQFYHFEGFDFAVLGIGGQEVLREVLPRLTRISVRERRTSTVAPTIVSASIATSHVDPGAEGEEMVARMVEAMRLIQGEGGARQLSIADPKIDQLRIARVLRAEILPALEKGEFSLNFQPKLRLSDGQVIGAEALLRWTSPAHGPVSPELAVLLSERGGFIRQLSDWVFHEVAKAQRRLHAYGHEIRIAINVSAAELDDALPERLLKALDEEGGHPDLLDIEITETALVSDLDRCSRVAQLLRERGMTVAVDDFGTGYSSLSYIGQLPIDAVKIDRSFIENLDGPNSQGKIVASIIDLTRTLGLQSVAEGVETAAQRDMLATMGCDAMQGYLAAPPMPLDAFVDFLDKN